MASIIEVKTQNTLYTSVTAKLYPDKSDTLAATLSSLTLGNRVGVFTFTNPGLNGLYLIQIFAGTALIFDGYVNLSSADGVYVASINRETALYVNATISSRAVPSDVQTSFTVPGYLYEEPPVENTIVAKRGDTLLRTLPVMGTITGWTTIFFTAKRNSKDDDSAAVIQVVAKSTGGIGLTRLNGLGTGFSASDASLTVTNASTGTVDLMIAASVMRQVVNDLMWDVEWIDSIGRVFTPLDGRMKIAIDITQAIVSP